MHYRSDLSRKRKNVSSLSLHLVLPTMLLVSFSSSQATEQTITPPNYNRCYPIVDLVRQHRCLMEEAIIGADTVRLRELVKTAYVNLNGPTETGNGTYLQHSVSVFSIHDTRASTRLLLEVGADPNIYGDCKSPPLMGFVDAYARNYKKSLATEGRDFVELFLNKKADPNNTYTCNQFDYSTQTHISHAMYGCESRDPDVVTFSKWYIDRLIKGGADVNYQTPRYGITALMQLAFQVTASQCVTFVEQLIKAGADVDIPDNGGRLAVDYGALYARRHIDSSLIKCVGTPSSPDDRLHQPSKEAIVLALVKAGSRSPQVAPGDNPCFDAGKPHVLETETIEGS